MTYSIIRYPDTWYVSYTLSEEIGSGFAYCKTRKQAREFIKQLKLVFTE